MISPPALRLLLADDHYIVLMGLQALLKLKKDMRVIATANDGLEAVELFRQHRPDVALLDLQMPKLNGIEAITRIRTEFPTAKILILSSFDREQDIHLALEAGASGYLLKESKLPELVAAIRQVHAGGTWITGNLAQLAAERAEQPDLSAREIEVLELVDKGLTNKEIAQVLGFSEDGAKHHLRRIFSKLGVSVRTEAIWEARRRGILRS